jgi:hypothetical protein
VRHDGAESWAHEETDVTDAELTRFLFLRDEPEAADLALVFGHSDPELAAMRARHAAGLFQRGYVPRLLFTGGPLQDRVQVTEADYMAGVAASHGVPEGALLLERRAVNTIQNAQNSAALLADHGVVGGLATVLLVSCPWHMRRVLLVSRRVFPSQVRLLCCPHHDECTAETWARDEAGRRRVVNEIALLGRLSKASNLEGRSR